MTTHAQQQQLAVGLAEQASAGPLATAGAAAWVAWRRYGKAEDWAPPAAIGARIDTLSTRQAGELSYYADTTAPGRPLVLVHGLHLAASALQVQPLFDHYRSRRPVYAPDLPGFGWSERGAQPFSPELYASALAELLRDIAAGAEPPDIVALSLSCEFVSLTALQHPSLVHSLAFIAPTGLSSTAPPTGIVEALARRTWQSPWLSRALFAALSRGASLERLLARESYGEADSATRQYALSTTRQPGAHHAPIAWLAGRFAAPEPVDSLYARLSHKVLVLHQPEPGAPLDRLAALLEARANWQYCTMARAGGLRRSELLAALDRHWAAVPDSAALLSPLSATEM
jgi:pimeloyl-ACP methyl ester carboxylesterase